MMYGGHPKGGRQEPKGSAVVKDFIQKLKELKNDLSKIDDRDIFHPEEGYARKIVEELGLKGVQLRRFYSEIRSIYDGLSDDKGEKELKYRLYKLYAITHYQVNRGVIKQDFGELLIQILGCLEKNFNKESLRKATDFLMAMVAYSKKET